MEKEGKIRKEHVFRFLHFSLFFKLETHRRKFHRSLYRIFTDQRIKKEKREISVSIFIYSSRTRIKYCQISSKILQRGGGRGKDSKKIHFRFLSSFTSLSFSVQIGNTSKKIPSFAIQDIHRPKDKKKKRKKRKDFCFDFHLFVESAY